MMETTKRKSSTRSKQHSIHHHKLFLLYSLFTRSSGFFIPTIKQKHNAIHPNLNHKHTSLSTRIHLKNDDIIVDTVAKEDNDNHHDGKMDKTSFRTLLDLALEQDPSFAEIRIPFIDPLGNNFIECKPHFNVQYNGVNYMIATPHDHTVGLCYTDSNSGKVVFLSDYSIGGTGSDESVKEQDKALMDDIFKIASMELSKSFDDQLKLRRTPSTFTIEGDLDQYLRLAWEGKEKQQKPKENIVEDLWTKTGLLVTDEDEDEDEYFETTMRKLLGNAYDDDDDDDDDDDEEIDPQIMELFDVFDDSKEEDIKSALNEIFKSDDDLKILKETTTKNKTDDANDKSKRDEAFAERLLSFRCDGKLFSLVKMTQPAVIVGREDPAVTNRRVLLTPQESLVLMPELEKLIVEELKDAGVIE